MIRPADIRRILVVSSGHITVKTARFLDATPSSQWPCAGGRYDAYGWFLYAHDENGGVGPSAIPDDLFAVMIWTRKQGCDYLLLDCDGDVVEALPHYDW